MRIERNVDKMVANMRAIWASVGERHISCPSSDRKQKYGEKGGLMFQVGPVQRREREKPRFGQI